MSQDKVKEKKPANPVINKESQVDGSIRNMPLDKLKAELDNINSQLNSHFNYIQGLKMAKHAIRTELTARYEAKKKYLHGSEWSSTVKAVSHSARTGKPFSQKSEKV